MTVRSEPPTSKPAEAPRSQGRARPRIGFLLPGHIERAFIVLLYAALGALVLLSVIGTFYGWRGEAAPLKTPLQFIADVQTGGIVPAVIVQVVLTIIQWGSRQLARHDRRWWLLYLAALIVSVYYNIQAYWIPLNELMAWYTAGALIIAGDVLPEFLAVRHE